MQHLGRVVVYIGSAMSLASYHHGQTGIGVMQHLGRVVVYIGSAMSLASHHHGQAGIGVMQYLGRVVVEPRNELRGQHLGRGAVRHQLALLQHH